MKRMRAVIPCCLLAALALRCSAADLDHGAWDALVKRYVDAGHRVDYQALNDHGAAELDAYIRRLAAPWPEGMSVNARKAALINAYNALTVRWIAANFPVSSIWRTRKPFKEPRHTLDGKKQSLNQIETTLRNPSDPRIHGALVCAALSCPPLRREAYTADSLDPQLDSNLREWLANRSLNEFRPDRELASVSSIFKWYEQDFVRAGGSVRAFLTGYAPAASAGFLREGRGKIEYKPYNWGLNDTSAFGAGYSKLEFYWDFLRNH